MSSIDVVVPCYRYGRFLRECVESVLVQDVPKIRVLIIDDASPDETPDVAADLIRKDSRVSFVRHSINRGHIATYNEGIDWTSGNCMLLLSADDYLLPGALSRTLNFMEAHPEVAFTFGNFMSLGRDGALRTNTTMMVGASSRVMTGRDFVELSGSQNIVSTPTAVVRTALLKRLGGYRPELPHSGDMELWLRLSAYGSVGYISEYQAVYREHASNMSLRYGEQWSLLDLLQRKACFDLLFQNHGSRFANPDDLRQRIYFLLARDAIACASAAFNECNMELSEHLTGVALDISPDIKGSLAWNKLACKRLVGPSAWRFVAREVSRLRAWDRALRPVSPSHEQAVTEAPRRWATRESAVLPRTPARRELATRLALSAQRLNIRLPPILANPLRVAVDRLAQSEAVSHGLEDWGGPLIPGREVESAHDREALRGAQVESAAQPPSNGRQILPAAVSSGQAAPAGVLSCLLLTASLDVGGRDEVVAFLARRLPRHGVRTAVLNASSNSSANGAPTGRLGRLLLEEGITTVELASDAGAQWLREWQPDVISAHDPLPWAIEIACRLSIPYIETLHGMHSLFNPDWLAEAQRSRQLDGIVAVSELVRRQYLQGNPGFPATRIMTIPNGVDDERRVPGNRDRARARLGIRDEFLFVSLARHCLQKNTYGLVAAFEDVVAEYPKAHLLIAGRPDDSAYFGQVERLRARLRCSDSIHLRDHTPDPAALLAAADGFVLNSFFEGWPLAPMEALHAGVPVILSEVGGAIEQVGRNGERGHVVANPLGDPLKVSWEAIRAARFAPQVNREPLVAAMTSLIRNRQRWQDSRAHLAAESALRFHPDDCLRSHARVLAAAAASGKRELFQGSPGRTTANDVIERSL